MASGIIFPTSVYGTLNAKYGTSITAYANTGGFPLGAGLQLGMFGHLFDGGMVRLMKANGVINANDFISLVKGNSNDYTVVQSPATANTIILLGVHDRLGAATAANDICWMTTYGIATGNCAAGLTGGNYVSSSAVAGRAGAFTVGTSVQGGIELLNDTAGAGNYPVCFR